MILFSGALKATQFFGVTGVLTATIAALMFVLMALKKYMWKNFVKANIVLFFVSGIVLYLDNEASGYIDMFLTSRFFIVRKLVLFISTCWTIVAFLSEVDKGNNKITELRTILQRESQNS
jgi:hypothetical protein